MQKKRDLSRHGKGRQERHVRVFGEHASSHILRDMHAPTTNNLRAIRQKNGLTLRQVAEQLGLQSIDRISRWERGLLYPHVLNFLKLLAIYGVRADEVYEGYIPSSVQNSAENPR